MATAGDSLQPDWVRPGLYLSSALTELHREILDQHGITHILQVGAGLEPTHLERYTYLCLPIYDLPEQDIVGCFPKAFAFIDAGLEAGGGVLVHCQAGISRSATVLIGFLMAREGLSADAATALVTAARSVVWPNPGFRQQLREWEELRCELGAWPGWSMARYLSRQYGDESVGFMAAMLGGAPQDRLGEAAALHQQQQQAQQLQQQQQGSAPRTPRSHRHKPCAAGAPASDAAADAHTSAKPPAQAAAACGATAPAGARVCSADVVAILDARSSGSAQLADGAPEGSERRGTSSAAGLDGTHSGLLGARTSSSSKGRRLSYESATLSGLTCRAASSGGGGGGGSSSRPHRHSIGHHAAAVAAAAAAAGLSYGGYSCAPGLCWGPE